MTSRTRMPGFRRLSFLAALALPFVLMSCVTPAQSSPVGRDLSDRPIPAAVESPITTTRP